MHHNLSDKLVKIAGLVYDLSRNPSVDKEHTRLSGLLAYSLRQLKAQINLFLEAEAGTENAKNFNLKPLQEALEVSAKDLKELLYTSVHAKFAKRSLLSTFDMCPKMAPFFIGRSLEDIDVSEESKTKLKHFSRKLKKEFSDFKVKIADKKHNGVCVVTGDFGSVVKVSLYQ